MSMTDTFRLKLHEAQTVETDWPNVTCFARTDFCTRCNRDEKRSPEQEVYGVNREGDLETKYRHMIWEFRCARHLDGEITPKGTK